MLRAGVLPAEDERRVFGRVPDGDAFLFEIGMRKMLKKYDSYGMLAGADELALGDDHSGIVELDPASAKPGDDFAIRPR